MSWITALESQPRYTRAHSLQGAGSTKLNAVSSLAYGSITDMMTTIALSMPGMPSSIPIPES